MKISTLRAAASLLALCTFAATPAIADDADAEADTFVREAALSIKRAPERRKKTTVVYTVMKSAPPTTAPAASPPEMGGFSLAAGAFETFDDAKNAHSKLAALGNARITQIRAVGRDLYRVQLGAWASLEAASEACSAALTLAVDECEIVPPRTP